MSLHPHFSSLGPPHSQREEQIGGAGFLVLSGLPVPMRRALVTQQSQGHTGGIQRCWVLLPVQPSQLWEYAVAVSLKKSKTHLLGLQINVIHFVLSPTDTWMETTTPVATPAPRDVSPSCDTSLKPPVQERNQPMEETASSTPSMLTKEKVGDLSCYHLHFIQVLASSPWQEIFCCSVRF